MMTKPDNEVTLNAFYRKVRPGGWWGKIATQNPDIQPDESGNKRWFGWFLGVLFIYSGLLGIGYILTAKTGWGIALILIAAVSAYGLFKTVDFGGKTETNSST